MRSPVAAIAWEFWNANRRGWLFILAALAACGFLLRLFAETVQQSENLQFLSYMPLVASLILATSFCNFTDRNRRDGIAGFPRHLFSLPINTRLMVSCAMACSLLSVVGIYAAWVKLVLQPLDVVILLRWPATLLAAFVVFYQAIIWCLCGFRLTRVVGMSLVATMLVAVGFVPTLVAKDKFWASEINLTGMLIVVMVAAYGATLVTVGAQRRGGARGWAGFQKFAERLASAIPHHQVGLHSPDAALFWIEWRRSGFVLPAAVMLTTALILGPVLWFTGRGPEKTTWAEMWLFIMPMLLAFPIGLGFGKPDFWSLDLPLPSFITTRPITAGQLLAAKMKSAACSALITWASLLLVAPACIYLFCDTKHWGHFANMSGLLYSPISQWLLPVLFLVAAVFITWSLLVGSLWLGYSGRAGFYYSMTGIGLTAFVTWFFSFVWWLDHPRSGGETLVGTLPWLPWALAALFTAKVWGTVLVVRELRRRRLISERSILCYLCVWLTATACLVLCAWFMSPRIEWFRNIAMLAGLCAIPAFAIAIAPLTIAWSRHR